MKEIEILVEVFDTKDRVKETLSSFNYMGLNKVIDEYYYDPKRDTLKPSKDDELYHCLRLRTKNNKHYITYKDDVNDNNKWLYSNEYETEVEKIDMLKEIFNKLGLVKFIEINNSKETYTYKDYEIVLEDVKDLGLFMEVEHCTNNDVDVKEIKRQIQSFINSLNLDVSEELNMGKPEMYIKKHNIKIES